MLSDEFELVSVYRIKRDLLIVAKKTLRERDRMLICLRMFKELAVDDCSKQIGISVGSFYTAYHRAEQRLTDAFRKQQPLLFKERL